MIRSYAILLLIGLSSTILRSQKSDLYLFDLLEVGGTYELHHARLLSEFNEGGYNNQPSFTDTYTLLISAAPEGDQINTDIYQLDLRSKELTRITHTLDREYSPTPSLDERNAFNCVVVDVNNENRQILWRYPIDRSSGGKAWLKEVKNVGYFRELPNDWVAIFEVGTPNKLWVVHKKTGERKFISNNIGRSLQVMSNGQLVYVHKFSDDYWFLKKLVPETFISEIIKKTLPESEDFCLLSDDSILMGHGSKLYRLNTSGDNQWDELMNLEKFALSNIKRLAFNGINQLVVVDQK